MLRDKESTRGESLRFTYFHPLEPTRAPRATRRAPESGQDAHGHADVIAPASRFEHEFSSTLANKHHRGGNSRGRSIRRARVTVECANSWCLIASYGETVRRCRRIIALRVDPRRGAPSLRVRQSRRFPMPATVIFPSRNRGSGRAGRRICRISAKEQERIQGADTKTNGTVSWIDAFRDNNV